jgi:DNA polymerase-3 subunit gamma/tau
LFSILDALLVGDAAGMLHVADDMATRSLSFDAALQELASLLTRVQVAQLAPQSVADDLPERARILQMAARLDPEFVQLAYQIAVHGRKELSLAPDDQAGFVMTLLRLHAFRPALAGDGNVGTRLGPHAAVAKASPAERPVGIAAMEPKQKSVRASAINTQASAAEPSPVANALPEAPVMAAGPVESSPAGGNWHAILAALKLGGMARELGQHCELLRIDAAQVVLCLSPTHRHLQMKPAQDKLQQALSEHFARPLQLAIELHEVAGDTPAAAAQRHRNERQDRAIAAVEQDDFVREVIDLFDATLIESSIKPV